MTAVERPAVREEDATPLLSTVSVTELERVTGVRHERARTWQRRFGFPKMIDGRIAVGDLPGILAVRQLIEAGEPVGAAMRQVLGGLAAPDVSSLEASFGSVAVPVTAWAGPEPLRLLWANAAARRAAGGSLIAAPERGQAMHRILQRVMAAADGAAVMVEHPSLCDARGEGEGEAVSLLALSVGGPVFVPAVAVVMELPPGEHPGVGDQGADRAAAAWSAGIARARRTLQRGAGTGVIGDVMAAVIDASGADDAVVVLTAAGDSLRFGRWLRSRTAPVAGVQAAAEIWRAHHDGRVSWLSEPAAARVTDGGGACAVVPLTVSGQCSGFIALQFPRRTPIPEYAEDLLLGLGAAVAATIGRDQALAARRRIGA